MAGRTFEIRIYTEKAEYIFKLTPKLPREIATAVEELKSRKERNKLHSG
ncbi:MAG: hypothetical protein ACPL0C_05440 [Candidatus Bathyarchaeales archaeon]